MPRDVSINSLVLAFFSISDNTVFNRNEINLARDNAALRSLKNALYAHGYERYNSFPHNKTNLQKPRKDKKARRKYIRFFHEYKRLKV